MEKLIQEETNKYAKRFYKQIKEANYKVEENSYYVNTQTKVKVICDKGHKYSPKPSNFNKGSRCGRCKRPNYYRTTETLKKELDELKPNEYEIIGEYEGSGNPTKLKHKNCGYVWGASITNLKKGYWCPRCAGVEPKTTESFKGEVKELTNNEYKVLGEYKSSQKKIKVKHEKCGHVYNVAPNNILRGKRCPKCAIKNANKNLRHTKEQVVERIEGLVGDEYILTSDFINFHEKIELKHNVESCGKSWSVAPFSFIYNGGRCPSCLFSRGEKKIENWLIKSSIKYEPQVSFKDCRNKKPLPFDFGVYKGNQLEYLIEFDGRQHTEEIEHWGGSEYLERVKYHDNIKNEYAKDNNIDLLRIPYWDYDNIEEILKENILLQHT